MQAKCYVLRAIVCKRTDDGLKAAPGSGGGHTGMMRMGTKRNEKRNAKDEIRGYERNREDETQTEAEVQGRQQSSSSLSERLRRQTRRQSTDHNILTFLLPTSYSPTLLSTDGNNGDDVLRRTVVRSLFFFFGKNYDEQRG